MEKEQVIDLSIYQINEKLEQKYKEKYINFFFLMDFWMQALEGGKQVSSFFISNHYQHIAIYGLGSLGRHLKTQLENSNFTIVYTIDKNVIEYNNSKYDLQNDMSNVPRADVIVVTPITEYISIKEKISKLTNSKIVSLEEVILSL